MRSWEQKKKSKSTEAENLLISKMLFIQVVGTSWSTSVLALEPCELGREVT
jgi:hypothetical protein